MKCYISSFILTKTVFSGKIAERYSKGAKKKVAEFVEESIEDWTIFCTA
jgi:hypothetical protein